MKTADKRRFSPYLFAFSPYLFRKESVSPHISMTSAHKGKTSPHSPHRRFETRFLRYTFAPAIGKKPVVGVFVFARSDAFF